MFPWLTNPTSLLQMYQQPQQGGFFGGQESMRNPQAYWANVNAQRKPGQSNWDTFMRGVLPQNMWPQQWKDDDRSDQNARGNQVRHRQCHGPAGPKTRP
jgi:hypothetical protein